MNKNRKEYSAPCVEMLEARVEKGFGTSGSGTSSLPGHGGSTNQPTPNSGEEIIEDYSVPDSYYN